MQCRVLGLVCAQTLSVIYPLKFRFNHIRLSDMLQVAILTNRGFLSKPGDRLQTHSNYVHRPRKSYAVLEVETYCQICMGIEALAPAFLRNSGRPK